jgi:calmodulin
MLNSLKTIFNKTNDYKPTKEDMQGYREAFQLYDKDKDGKISARELKRVFHALGIRLSEIEIRRICTRGYISFDEFVSAISCQKEMGRDDKPVLKKTNSSQKVLHDTFAVFDTNKDGLITIREIQEVMRKLGIELLSEEDLKVLFEDVDKNRDGKITYEEFVKLMSLCM